MNQVKASTPEEQLQLLKAMTLRTGAIHEAQALQLKMWPTLIENITKSEAQVDTEKKTVTFVCESSGLRPSKHQRLLFENIEKWVRNILWNETRVVIKINKKRVFDSSNQ
jgi:hypothetical protein